MIIFYLNFPSPRQIYINEYFRFCFKFFLILLTGLETFLLFFVI